MLRRIQPGFNMNVKSVVKYFKTMSKCKVTNRAVKLGFKDQTLMNVTTIKEETV